jgi:hypothetical protein
MNSVVFKYTSNLNILYFKDGKIIKRHTLKDDAYIFKNRRSGLGFR